MLRCRRLPRANWLVQELLSTFEFELAEVTLVPAESGVFEVIAAGATGWERKKDVGFPATKQLKRRVGDVIAPEKRSATF